MAEPTGRNQLSVSPADRWGGSGTLCRRKCCPRVTRNLLSRSHPRQIHRLEGLPHETAGGLQDASRGFSYQGLAPSP